MQESEALMEECYTKVIEKAVKQGSVKLAAVTCIEVAECFLKLNNYLRAYHYFLKGFAFFFIKQKIEKSKKKYSLYKIMNHIKLDV